MKKPKEVWVSFRRHMHSEVFYTLHAPKKIHAEVDNVLQSLHRIITNKQL